MSKNKIGVRIAEISPFDHKIRYLNLVTNVSYSHSPQVLLTFYFFPCS